MVLELVVKEMTMSLEETIIEEDQLQQLMDLEMKRDKLLLEQEQD